MDQFPELVKTFAQYTTAFVAVAELFAIRYLFNQLMKSRDTESEVLKEWLPVIERLGNRLDLLDRIEKELDRGQTQRDR